MKEGQRYWLSAAPRGGYYYLTCLCIVILASTIQTSHAAGPYVDYCPLGLEVVNVEWDGGLEKFFRSPDERRSQVLILADADAEIEIEIEIEADAEADAESDTTIRHLRKRILDTSSSNNNNIIFQARMCTCASEYRGGEASYCLVQNDENLCRVPQSKEDPIQCYKTTSTEIFSRNAWPVAILWMAAMMLYMIGTEGGRLGVRFLFSKLCCFKFIISRSNQNIVNEIVARESDARRRFQRAAANRASRRLEQDPVTYILKTKEYKKQQSPNNHNFDGSSSPGDLTLPMTPNSTMSFETTDGDCNGNIDLTCLPCTNMDMDTERKDNDDTFSDNEDGVTCTICIMDIEDGDRVGVLECNHLFHSDCLKSWIKRKNVCPLCQSPDIAREKDSPTSTSNNDSDSNVENDGSNISQDNRVVRSTGIIVDANNTRNRRRRQMGLGVNTNLNRSVQRDLFQVNGRGRGGSGRGRVILVGDPVATVRIQANHNNNRGFNFNGRETPVQRRDRLNSMRRAWNPT